MTVLRQLTMKTTKKTTKMKTQIPITKLKGLRYFNTEHSLYFPPSSFQLSNAQKLEEVKVELQQTVNHRPRIK